MGKESEGSYSTRDTTRDPTIDTLSSMLSTFVGSPQLATALTNVLDTVAGKYIRSGMLGGAGGTVPYAGAPLFGSFDAPASMYNSLWNQTLSNMQANTQTSLNMARQEFLAGVHTRLYGSVTPELDATGYSLTNLAGGYLWNKALQPDLLMAGLQEGHRYAGVLPITGRMDQGARDLQAQINAAAGQMGNAIGTDYIRNTEKYYGLTGQEVGQMYAESMRSGNLGGAMEMFRNAGNNQALIDEAKQAVQQQMQDMASQVQALRSVFQGSVRDVIRQVNALSGGDFSATFGADAVGMSRAFGTAGIVSGHSAEQMQMLASGMSSIYQQMGADGFGTLAGATQASLLLGSARGLGSNFMFNEQRFRENLMQRTAGASESSLARSISGAYAMIEMQSGTEAAEAFMSKVNANTGRLDSRTLEDLMRSSGLNASAADARMASYTDTGERVRAQGKATMAVLNSNIETVREDRRRMITSVLEAEGMGEFADFVASGDMTSADIENRLLQSGMDRSRISTITGLLASRFEQDARRNGMGNRWEQDRFLALGANRDRLARLTGSVDTMQDLYKVYGTRGYGGGFMGLVDMFDKRKRGGMSADDDITMRELLGSVLGTSVSDVQLQEFQDRVLGIDSKGQAFDESAILYEIALTGSYKGKSASAEDVKSAREMLKDTFEGKSVDRTKMGDYLKRVGAADDVERTRMIREATDLKIATATGKTASEARARYSELSKKGDTRTAEEEAEFSKLSTDMTGLTDSETKNIDEQIALRKIAESDSAIVLNKEQQGKVKSVIEQLQRDKSKTLDDIAIEGDTDGKIKKAIQAEMKTRSLLDKDSSGISSILTQILALVRQGVEGKP